MAGGLILLNKKPSALLILDSINHSFYSYLFVGTILCVIKPLREVIQLAVMTPACLPCGTALGATFDIAMAERIGRLLSDGAHVKGTHVVLGQTNKYST